MNAALSVAHIFTYSSSVRVIKKLTKRSYLGINKYSKSDFLK